jgi:hypothetical protein
MARCFSVNVAFDLCQDLGREVGTKLVADRSMPLNSLTNREEATSTPPPESKTTDYLR